MGVEETAPPYFSVSFITYLPYLSSRRRGGSPWASQATPPPSTAGRARPSTAAAEGEAVPRSSASSRPIGPCCALLLLIAPYCALLRLIVPYCALLRLIGPASKATRRGEAVEAHPATPRATGQELGTLLRLIASYCALLRLIAPHCAPGNGPGASPLRTHHKRAPLRLIAPFCALLHLIAPYRSQSCTDTS